MRYGCRGCRRNFWIRADAGSRRQATAPRPTEDAAPRAPTPPAALDFEVRPSKSEKVDPTALNADFERIRRPPDDSGEPKRKSQKKKSHKSLRF